MTDTTSRPYLLALILSDSVFLSQRTVYRSAGESVPALMIQLSAALEPNTPVEFLKLDGIQPLTTTLGEIRAAILAMRSQVQP